MLLARANRAAQRRKGHGRGPRRARFLLDRFEATDAIVVLDSDCQHPPGLIPEFVTASRHADVVIGNRADRCGMPLSQRVANAVADGALSGVTGRRVRDSQNGMRLYRVDALRRVPLGSGRYEDESRHLKALIRQHRRVAWVDMPTVYNGEPSSFRPLADIVRVARVLLGPIRPALSPGSTPSAQAVRDMAARWSPTLAVSLGAAFVVAALLPVLQPLDSALFLTVNGLGAGPEWVYDAFDPHTRNYVLLFAMTVVVATIVLREPR